jgi:hypothetical protein
VTRLLLDKTPGDRVVLRQRAPAEATAADVGEPVQRVADAPASSTRRSTEPV